MEKQGHFKSIFYSISTQLLHLIQPFGAYILLLWIHTGRNILRRKNDYKQAWTQNLYQKFAAMLKIDLVNYCTKQPTYSSGSLCTVSPCLTRSLPPWNYYSVLHKKQELPFFAKLVCMTLFRLKMEIWAPWQTFINNSMGMKCEMYTQVISEPAGCQDMPGHCLQVYMFFTEFNVSVAMGNRAV